MQIVGVKDRANVTQAVTRYARDLRHSCASNRKTGNGGATYIVERETSDPGFGNSFAP